MSSSSAVFNSAPTSRSSIIVNVNGVYNHGDVININVYPANTDRDEKIYRWLAAPDSSGNYHAAREKHHGQTGAWFIEGEQFAHWKETPGSALWVYGIPGCGKTVICSTVIEDILRLCEDRPSYACTYFFFDNRSAQDDLTLHEKLIRSLIQQFADQSGGVPAPLMQIHGHGHQQPSIPSLQIALQKIMEGFERAYIVIDALDECTDRPKALAWIEQLLQQKAGNLRVLISSRLEVDINECFDSIAAFVRVPLIGKCTHADIEAYIDVMLSRMIRWDAPTTARARDVLVADADGMFRLVALQIDELSNCCTPHAVSAQLQALPKDLDGIYEKVLLKSSNPRDLKQFLLWLAFSSRPLKADELADVLTVDIWSNDPPIYDSSLRCFGPKDMLVTCSSFVTEFQGTLKLAHMSIKEYLVSDRLREGAACYFSVNDMLSHSLIARTCLSYLLHMGKLSCTNPSTIQDFPLGPYAAKCWIPHMQMGYDDEHVSHMVSRLFFHEGNALSHWVRLEDPDTMWWRNGHSNYEKALEDIAPPLYYACSYGLEDVVQQALNNGADVGAQGGLFGNALQAASYHGREAVVDLLLKEGADVNMLGGEYGHALQAASHMGHDGVVRILLDRGADVNPQGGTYGNALEAASYTGHDTVVRLLLEHGADVNAQGALYGNALQAASHKGSGVIAHLLLDHGAGVNMPGGLYGSALQAASHMGHDGVARILLYHGADVNARGGMYGDALQAASCMGHDVVVRLLLDHGADISNKHKISDGMVNNDEVSEHLYPSGPPSNEPPINTVRSPTVTPSLIITQDEVPERLGGTYPSGPPLNEPIDATEIKEGQDDEAERVIGTEIEQWHEVTRLQPRIHNPAEQVTLRQALRTNSTFRFKKSTLGVTDIGCDYFSQAVEIIACCHKIDIGDRPDLLPKLKEVYRAVQDALDAATGKRPRGYRSSKVDPGAAFYGVWQLLRERTSDFNLHAQEIKAQQWCALVNDVKTQARQLPITKRFEIKKAYPPGKDVKLEIFLGANHLTESQSWTHHEPFGSKQTLNIVLWLLIQHGICKMDQNPYFYSSKALDRAILDPLYKTAALSFKEKLGRSARMSPLHLLADRDCRLILQSEDLTFYRNFGNIWSTRGPAEYKIVKHLNGTLEATHAIDEQISALRLRLLSGPAGVFQASSDVWDEQPDIWDEYLRYLSSNTGEAVFIYKTVSDKEWEAAETWRRERDDDIPDNSIIRQLSLS